MSDAAADHGSTSSDAPHVHGSFWQRLRKTPLRDLLRCRVSGRLDLDAKLAATDLTPETSGLVREVVRRTRLWRLEKAHVADELIAHFRDARAAGVEEVEAVAAFGDAAATANLIRRAKRHNRPFAWKALSWSGRALGVLVLLYVGAALWLLTGSPSVTTDYVARLNAHASSLAPEDAAWPEYRAALTQLNLYEEVEWDTPNPVEVARHEERQRLYGPGGDYEHADYGGLGFGFEPDPRDGPFFESMWDRINESLRPGASGWDYTATYLEAQAERLERVRRAAARPALGFEVGFAYGDDDQAAFVYPVKAWAEETPGPHPMLIALPLPHAQPLRDLSKLLAADALRAAEAGDGDTACADLVAVFRMARHVDDQPVLVTGFVRMGMSAHGFDTLQRIMVGRADVFSDAHLRELAHVIEAEEPDLSYWFTGERMWFYDVLQRVYTDDGGGGGRVTMRGLEMLDPMVSGPGFGGDGSLGSRAMITASLPAAAVGLADRAASRAAYDDVVARTIADTAVPFWQRIAPGYESAWDRYQAEYDSPVQRVRYMLVDALLPPLDAVTANVDTFRTWRDATLTAIALELYRREHGAWPEQLPELTPRYLPTLPRDPFRDGVLCYRLIDGRPVLYSVGIDGDDDGARLADGPGVHTSHRTPHERNHSIRPAGWWRGTENLHPKKPLPDADWVLWPMPLE